MYVWQNGVLVGDYAEGAIDSVKFVKPEPTIETLRNEPTEGGLSKTFSIADGVTVFFSQGNLRYKPSTKEWAFASSQTSRIGTGNTSIAEDYTGWIDLFGWGTSGYNNVAPYISVQDYTKYANVQNIAGSNYDWGVYNKISNGAHVVDSLTMNGYHSLDLTSLLVDPRTRIMSSTEGLILKSKRKGDGFSVLATGDSSYFPQILEIN